VLVRRSLIEEAEEVRKKEKTSLQIDVKIQKCIKLFYEKGYLSIAIYLSHRMAGLHHGIRSGYFSIAT
jgi:fructose-1,6-bisphosphatase